MALMQEALEDLKDPSIRHIFPISGGKDSAALAVYMKTHYPQVPFEFLFTDTDCELPETYEFLERLEALLGVKIHRTSILDYMPIQKKEGRGAFDILLNERYGGYLPSPRSRWCTAALKIKTFEKFVGDSIAYSYIGLRADEEGRQGYVPKKPPVFSQKPNIRPVYPFREARLQIDDIKEILDDSGLGLPKYYEWRSRSGCYFCFYQQIGEWQGLKERHPELFEKAKTYEKTGGDKSFTWVDGRSLTELEKISLRYKIQDVNEAEGCAICHI